MSMPIESPYATSY